MENIPDDPKVVQPIFDELRNSFYVKAKTRPLKYRKTQLQSLLQGLKDLEEKFHEAWDKDLGGGKFSSQMLSYHLTIGETTECLHKLEEWNAPISADTPLSIGPGKSYMLPEPLGVILVVGAWNYPLSLTIPYCASAIAGGNCVIVKSSEMAPATSKVLKQLFEKYLDPECYRLVEGKAEVAKAITKLPFDKIIFTGSTEKGKLVARAAADNLTPCLLELGGKSPTIVDRDADITNAVLRISQGRFTNAGQSCVACDYIYVHKDIKDRFVSELKKTVLQFYGEDPTKSKDFGRIINEFHCNRLKGYLDDNHGGKVILGGQVNLKDRYVAPTLIDSPKTDSKLMKDEIFGPILPIFEFENIDTVIEFINKRDKPLALYYYGSGSSPSYKKVRELTSSGALLLNESLIHFAHAFLPFGGVGASGMGYVHGHQGFKEVVHFKPVFEKGCINTYPFNARYPPYTAHKQKLLLSLLTKPQLKQKHLHMVIGFIVLALIFVLAFKYGAVDIAKKSVSNLLKGGKDL